MTSRRNSAGTGIGSGLSTTTGKTDHQLREARILRLVLIALLLWLPAGTVERSARAQPGRAGAPSPQGQNRNGMHVFSIPK